MVSMANSTRRIALSVLGVLLTVILAALVVFIGNWAGSPDQAAADASWPAEVVQVDFEIVHEPLITLAAAGELQGQDPLETLWEAAFLPHDLLDTDASPGTGDSS